MKEREELVVRECRNELSGKSPEGITAASASGVGRESCKRIFALLLCQKQTSGTEVDPPSMMSSLDIPLLHVWEHGVCGLSSMTFSEPESERVLAGLQC